MDASTELRRMIITAARALAALDGVIASRAHVMGAFGNLSTMLRQEFDRALLAGPDVLDDDGEVIVPTKIASDGDTQTEEVAANDEAPQSDEESVDQADEVASTAASETTSSDGQADAETASETGTVEEVAQDGEAASTGEAASEATSGSAELAPAAEVDGPEATTESAVVEEPVSEDPATPKASKKGDPA
jgi:hypothetical protein